MADNVPVCDVLVEAMEYLAKLGSNLRTRSETLKEKRIRRDKLKNAHAVQKAAKKVLLICELSKKSLENVEVGVNRVLRLVDKSQAAISVGGNSDRGSPGDKTKTSKADDRPSTSEKKDYQYFRYRSYKLKIRKKVQVKHYMSVNVFAKELPKSIEDKYPVYYDCKLYRMRKRKALKEQERIEILESIEKSKDDLALDAVKKKSRKNSEKQIDSEAEECDNKSSPKKFGVITEKRKLSFETNSEVQKCTKDDEMSDSSVKNKERCDSDSNTQINKERKKSSEKSEDDARTIERQIECKKSLLEDSESENDFQGEDESVEKTKERKPKNKSDVKGNKTQSKKNDSSPERLKSDSKKSKDASWARKERKQITVIKSDSEDETKKDNECSTEKSDKKTFGENENISKTEKKEKIKSSRRKKRILSTDSESSRMESDKKSKLITNELSEDKPKRVDSDKEELLKYSEKEYKSKEKESNNCSRRSRSIEKKEDSNSDDCPTVKNKGDIKIDKKDVIDLASDDEHSGTDKTDQIERQKENKVSNKPLIKCVSLTKLLKPDIIPLVMPASAIKNQDKKSATKDSQTERTKKTVRYQDEEEFWSQKRVEVKAFKPKEFSIKITRLPLVNVDVFLQTHKIKKIIQGGKVIHEIRNENKQSKTNSTDLDDSQDKNKDNFIQCRDISKVKNALLNDSDSDEEVSKENKKNSVTDIKSSEKESMKKNKNESDNRSDDDDDDTGSNEKESENNSDGNTEVLEKDTTTKDCGKELENKSFKNYAKKKNVNESENNSDNVQSNENKQSKTNSTSLDDSQDKNEDNFKQCPDISKVKNALLNDSDSDEEVSKENKKNSANDIISSEKESTKKNKNESDNRSDDDDTGSNEKESENNSDGNTEVLEKDTSTKDSGKELENKSFKYDDRNKNVNESENNSDNVPKKENKQSKTNSTGLDDSQEKNEDNFIQCPDISKVKNSLLNDSDSDEEVSNKNKKNSVPISSEKESTKKNKNKLDNRSVDDTRSNEKELENKSDGNTELLERETSTKDSEKESENKSLKNDDKKKNVNESEINSDNVHSNNNVDGGSELNNKNDSNFSLMLLEQENNLVDQENATHKPPGEEITPPQEDDPETVKSALLNSSSNSTPTSPSSSKHKKSKRKHIMESMKAKKMLLNYSSSSEDEFEKVIKGFHEIKKALLQCGSSDDDMSKNDKASEDKKSSDFESDSKKKRSREQLSSDSEENVIRKVKRKKRKILKTRRPSKNNSRSPSPAKKDEENVKSGEEGEDKVSKASTIDQVDGTMDEQSNSSNSKMGRSNEKAGSSQNSDAPDDKDIDGLTNLSSLTKSRRRRDSDAAGDSISKRTRKGKISKATPLIQGEEGLLEVAMTDDESGAESEGGVEEEEDLPPVSLSGLNGAAIGELAKDDLLEESDSSCSNEKDQQSEDNVKKEESSSEDQVKLKRRKNAISSDSEAGSSRRKRNVKDDDVRVSDFEDSETESSEPIKKSKKKKKVDSDESAGSSNEAGKKKRKRIKLLDDSEASGSDSDNEGRNKHGRKNIRKVMGKSQLEEATKKAARQEKERIARIAERQKLYNNLEFDESGKPDEVVLDKVVLDFDPETKEPLIEVDRGLVKKLKPHQANGIKFMWDACFESVKRIKKDKGSGCILAHCMGLGKTLQVVSLTHTLLIHSELTKVERVLVVCPLSTVLNWVNEFHMWLKHAENDYEVDIYELSKYKQNSERAFQLSQWYTHGGVCVLGYEMFRNLSADNAKKYKKKMLKTFQEALVDPGPDMVVCDEGHLLKNEKTSLSQSMNRVRTLRRIVLTGTPLQNNLKEYYCMVQFVKPNLLGKYNEYLNRFVNPITNGQYTDSTEHDIRVMKRRSHVLHKMLDGAVQRRDYGVLAPFLPPKHEYVLFITLSEIQVKLYQHYLENYSRRPQPGKSSGFLFPDFQSLQRIWTHPLVLKYNSERYELMQQKKRDKEEEDSEGSLVDFIDDDSTPEDSSTEESSDDLSDLSDDSRKKSKKKKEKKKAKETAANRRRGTRANPENMEVEEVKDIDQIEGRNDNPTEWWIPLVTDEELDDVRNSHKLQLLLEILRQCEAIGDKLLVFSQSLYSLDLIEHFLGKIDEATQEGRVDDKLGGHVGSWAPGVDYFRLDGSTSCENRSIWCKNFNREDNPRARLFLISTRAGGLGINLVAANRVVIFDVSWNPSHDVQSIFRVYRFGQKKPCYIYRFLAMGTMEEKIYERQVTKQAISKRVIDEQQIDRHYAENDLAELYKFEPTPPTPRPVPLVPKDRLFAEMLKQHENCIYKFHEHDSLLENKEEETLTEEERKAAWDDFENEKNRPPPVPFANTWPPHNGMAGLLAQQQQQLAFAALASMLRKDMPGLTEEQIRGMLPLIYSSNPGLMQKLNDIYKYPQPSMMNPAAMMNPIMNPVGGGTSGMQYEPPWAREQQQQQQLRLQQLMQHQNMGAKYYAGGLGSRDPVAMALQQQRAREIMLGERGGAAAAAAGGRPRGRPPLQPRAPAPGDVVNLDSD